MKKLLILLLVLRMAMPLGAEEQVKSLFDNGEPVPVKEVVPARPPTLIPTPEVPPVPSFPKEITLELYEQPKAASFSSPQDSTHIVSIGLDDVSRGFATVVVVSNPQGCSYGVTCAHVVAELQPKDIITIDHLPSASLVAKDTEHDLAVLEFNRDLGTGVELSLEEVNPDDKLVSYGSTGFLPLAPFNKDTLDKMTEIPTVVKYVDENYIFTKDDELHGRSGSGLYRDGKLVGVFQGIVAHNNKVFAKKYWGLAIYGRSTKILPLLTPVSYNVVFYGAKVPESVPQEARIVEVDEKNFSTETATGLVLLDFWATWCMPCKAMEPVIKQLEYIKIAHVNLDKCPNIAKKFNVGTIPRFILLRDGVMVDGSLTGIQPQKTLQDLINKHDAARRQYEMFSENDKRITVSWLNSPVPEFIAKQLSKGYQMPVGVWSVGNNHYSWPQNPGVYTVDQLLEICIKSKAEPMQALAMGGRYEQPVGSVTCAPQIDQLFGWFNDYLKNRAVGKLTLHRSGARKFNLYGGKATDLKLETLLGKTGGLDLSITYPEDTPEVDKLPVRELKFGFMFDGDDVVFSVTNLRVIGLVRIVDGKIDSLQMKEQPQGFIGVLSLLSILSYIHTAYVLLYPVADIELGGEISVTAQRVDDDNIVISFEQGKQPFVKIKSLMTFNLGINQVLINKAAKTIIAKFDGTIFAKQYTLHYR